MTGTPVWAQLAYLVAAVCFILALKGLSSPKHARKGNLLGAFGAVLACVTVFFYAELDHLVWILVAIAVGSVVGAVGAQRVQMTQMPQLVALFNGVGGGAAALVALLELGDIAGAGRRSAASRSPRRRSRSWSGRCRSPARWSPSPSSRS